MVAGQIDRGDDTCTGAAWDCTRDLSPRLAVRVATIDAYGHAVNQYTGERRVDGVEPDRPWAVYLAGADGRYRLLAFDLDAKANAEVAVRDAGMIAGLLSDVGLGAVVCESGPGGGRHVWTALDESVDADTVATLARLARHVCPSLDIAPLVNPATGCVRPPGAPHRSGGRSRVLSGDLSTLTNPTGTAEQVRRLIEALAQLVDDSEPTRTVDPRRPLPVDDHARLYLPGPRRELPAASAAALHEDAACGDASAVLWRVLIGAAAAHWHHADIAELVATAPGLEHIRTYRDRSQRRPRTRTDAQRVLRRQWDRAVRYVATSGRQVGDDPTFDARASATAALVRHVQSRADAAGGRWTHGGGPTDRRVLDVLCTLALQAVQTAVEADIRRLALLAGIGRETARTALLRLAADGWIAQVAGADGPHAATWAIDPPDDFHRDLGAGRSQADPRPAGAGSAERTALLHSLTHRLTDAAHDLFTAGVGGLGHHAGNAYARTSTEPQSTAELARQTGDSPAATARTLNKLVSAGVLKRSPQGWCRYRTDRRTAAARRAGVDGRLAQRARRYLIERELWAWWQAEDAWMRAPRRPGAKRRPARGQLTLVPETGTHAYGPHPRRADGRLDWRQARRVIEHDRYGQAPRRRPTETDPLPAARTA
ncbi:hypothetical protein GZ998_08880 [Actinomyces sp. 594]|uniref:hypothetical protein n=1 Tax=Actinomyces sp. 594 TaxID=2057793 RepID=UPI001C569A63|nr:hypothetical protein [Actinomyces sp. 594]MBW3069614.1 hypothetical protein [Actinomyces sp. 594]